MALLWKTAEMVTPSIRVLNGREQNSYSPSLFTVKDNRYSDAKGAMFLASYFDETVR